MKVDEEVSVVNIVASGKFDVELDLASVAEDLEGIHGISEVEHSRRRGNRLLIYFNDNECLGILAPTGVYVFTGGDTHEEVNKAKKYLFNALSELGIISGADPNSNEVEHDFEVKNLVCTADLGRDINLDALSIALGLENTEYEPEQFPGLVYRPPNNGTLLVFATGKVVINGVTTESAAASEFADLINKIEDLLE